MGPYKYSKPQLHNKEEFEEATLHRRTAQKRWLSEWQSLKNFITRQLTSSGSMLAKESIHAKVTKISVPSEYELHKSSHAAKAQILKTQKENIFD